MSNKKYFNQILGFTCTREGLIANLTLFICYSIFAIIIHYGIIHCNYTHTNYLQLIWSKFYVIGITMHLSILLMVKKTQFNEFLNDYFKEPGSPYNLAVFRIIWFTILSGHFFIYCPEKFIAFTHLPESSKVGLPFMDWLIYLLPVNPTLYVASCRIAGTLCLLVLIGLFTRKSLILLLPFAFYSLGVPMFYGKISHFHLLLWLPMLLCFSPCADVLSIDSLLNNKKGLIRNECKYLIPFKMLWISFAIIYFFAGIVKLWDAGFNWALGPNMINQMQWEWVEHYDQVPNFRLDQTPMIAKIAGLLTIYFELLYFLFLLLPRYRWMAFFASNIFHLACGYFMYIDFINIRIAHISYINWHAILNYLKGKKTQVGNALPINLKYLWQNTSTKYMFRVGIMLISINFLFSAFKIHSFPFSSFPTYSNIAPSEIEVLKISPITSNGTMVDFKKLMIEKKFRWENFRPYEQKIISSSRLNDINSLKLQLKDYWELLNHSLKTPPDIQLIKFSIQKFSIVPEKRNIILNDSLIYCLDVHQ